MTIRSYIDENGKKLYKVSVNLRSQVNPKIRKQKAKKGFESKAAAERFEKQTMQECSALIHKLDGEGYSWSQIVSRWYEFKKTDQFEPISSPVLEDYLAALKTWTHIIWSKPAMNVSRSDIKSIISNLESNQRSKSFQSKLKGTIARVFTWGIEEGLIKNIHQPPTWGINVSRKSEKVPLVLNQTLYQIS